MERVVVKRDFRKMRIKKSLQKGFDGQSSLLYIPSYCGGEWPNKKRGWG
jgi:hypothetical protein